MFAIKTGAHCALLNTDLDNLRLREPELTKLRIGAAPSKRLLLYVVIQISILRSNTLAVA